MTKENIFRYNPVGEFGHEADMQDCENGEWVEYKDYEKIQQKYMELLYAVQSKWMDESRHETALRYIRQAQQGDSVGGQGIE